MSTFALVQKVTGENDVMPINKEVADFAEATYWLAKDLFDTSGESFAKDVLRKWLDHLPEPFERIEVEVTDKHVTHVYRYQDS